MNKEKTVTTVKNETRVKAFEIMLKMFITEYGENKVIKIGDSEIAVEIDISPTGEKIYATFSPTIKDYKNRTTRTKEIKAFNPFEIQAEYEKKNNEKAKKAEEIKKKKQEKIKKDNELREKRKAEIEKRNQKTS